LTRGKLSTKYRHNLPINYFDKRLNTLQMPFVCMLLMSANIV